MIETITEMWSFAFIQRAIIVGSLISVSAALLGVILVLKRYAMIGDRTLSCGIWIYNNSHSIWMGATCSYIARGTCVCNNST